MRVGFGVLSGRVDLVVGDELEDEIYLIGSVGGRLVLEDVVFVNESLNINANFQVPNIAQQVGCIAHIPTLLSESIILTSIALFIHLPTHHKHNLTFGFPQARHKKAIIIAVSNYNFCRIKYLKLILSKRLFFISWEVAEVS